MSTTQRSIKKRAVILGLAALAGGGLLAQDSPQVAPAPPPAVAENPTSGATESAAPADPAAPVLAPVDQSFLQKAAELHATGAELAKLTEKNAGTEEVQALGQELLAEHTRSIAALREIARTKSFELTANPTASQQATISEFAGKVGQAFDDGYRTQALSNHEEAIRLFADASRTAKDSDVRNFAERSLGDMKERHAAMGGDEVKLKGEIALKLPKSTKTSVAATTKSGKGAKGSKTKSTAAADTANATEPPSALPAETRTKTSRSGTVTGVASTTEAASEPAFTSRNATSTTKVAARANPPKVSAPSASEDYTERESDVRVYDPTAPASRSGQASSNRAREARLEPLIAEEPSEVRKPGSTAVASHADAPRQSSVSTTVADEETARGSRARTSSRPARSTTSQELDTDREVSAAPVARVVVTPRRVSRTATVETAPPASGPRVIIQQAPSRRIFRLFSGDNDDD
jgi:putative membrane protein